MSVHGGQRICRWPSKSTRRGSVELVHQAMIVRRDDDRGAEPIELDEQAQQPIGDHRIDVAGRLVGEQKLGRPITARAMAALCFSPPERISG